MAKVFLYFARDDVSETVIDWFCAPTDGAAIRSAVPIFSRLRPIGDVSFFASAVLDSETGKVLEVFDEPRSVDKDAYAFPETPSAELGESSDPQSKVEAFNEATKDLKGK